MIVALDVGQSHARLRALDRPDLGTHEVTGFAINLALPGAGAQVADSIAESVYRSFGELDAATVELRVGLSGYDAHASGREATGVAERAGRALDADRVTVGTDDVAWYRAALAERPGVLVAVGTGAVALGSDALGHWNRVDGIGHLLGDDGSGYRIGRAGLRSAIHAADGRGGSLELLRRAELRYGSAPAIAPAIFATAFPASEVAGFARDVAEAALVGDADAVAIWTSAGQDIARSIRAAAAVVRHAPGPIDVSCQGAVFQAHDLLWDALSASLASGGPELEVTRAPVDPLEGAPDPTAATRFPGLVVEWVRA